MFVEVPFITHAERWLAAAGMAPVRPVPLAGSILHSALFLHAQKIVMTRFLLLWLLLAAFIAVAGFLLSGFSNPSPVSPVPQVASALDSINRRKFSLVDGLAGAAFLLFFFFYVFVIFHKEDFAYYDDDVMTEYSVQGVNYAPPIWPDIGRFFPLADQEFNVARYVTRSPIGYHALAVVELAILLVVLFFVLERLRLRYRFLIMAAAMLGPSFIIPFTGFVYPERNVLFWLAIMVLCLQRYTKTNASIYFVGCLLATHFALYYKETVVLFVVAYAVTRILLQFDAARRANRRSWLQLARENSLSIGILAVSTIYVVLFLVVMLPHHSSEYIAEHSEALKDVLSAYLHFDWLPFVFVPVLAIRFARFFISGAKLDLLWDSLGVGAAAYYFTILALRLNAGNYMAPVDFFALLYLAIIVSAWVAKPTHLRIALVAIAVAAFMIHDAAYSAFRMVERKETISTKVQLAEFLDKYAQTTRSGTIDVFFPYASAFHLMGFSDFLQYKGLRLASQNAAASGASPQLVIKGTGVYPNNRCMDYRAFPCIHEEQAGAGSLIIVLPEDHASALDVQNMSKDSSLLFSLDPPDSCTKRGSWLRSLHAISSEFSVTPLPDRWLCIDVFKKRPDSAGAQKHL